MHTLNKTIHRTLVPPIVMIALGCALLWLGYSQPTWIDGRIGPGLFAQWLAKGIIGLSAIWFLLGIVEGIGSNRRSDIGSTSTAGTVWQRYRAGASLLCSVLVFIGLMPHAGMILACASTAAIAGFGAGDKSWRAVLVTAVIAILVSMTIGLSLMPPTTRLWPWSPFGYG